MYRLVQVFLGTVRCQVQSRLDRRARRLVRGVRWREGGSGAVVVDPVHQVLHERPGGAGGVGRELEGRSGRTMAMGPKTAVGRAWLGGLAALVLLAVLAVLSLTEGSDPAPKAAPGTAQAAAPGAEGAPAARVARRAPQDPLAVGRVDAPVVIAEWADFQCPFCRAYTLDTEPALMSQYVDSGRVRVEWHDFAYLGPESVLGARAARAAGRQGKFWAFHDALYRNQPPENSGAVTDASLAATAKALGLDMARFERDYADPAIAAAVKADQEQGTRLGLSGVPSFVIGGRILVGAQPLQTFQQAIDTALTQNR